VVAVAEVEARVTRSKTTAAAAAAAAGLDKAGVVCMEAEAAAEDRIAVAEHRGAEERSLGWRDMVAVAAAAVVGRTSAAADRATATAWRRSWRRQTRREGGSRSNLALTCWGSEVDDGGLMAERRINQGRVVK